MTDFEKTTEAICIWQNEYKTGWPQRWSVAVVEVDCLGCIHREDVYFIVESESAALKLARQYANARRLPIRINANVRFGGTIALEPAACR